MNSEAFDEWTGRARKASVEEFLKSRGLWLSVMAGDRGVPCPACGGNDRFAVNSRKNVFTCRASGAGGGALALWAHLNGLEQLRGADFLAACTEVTGDPAPVDGAGDDPVARAVRDARAREMADDVELKAREQDLENRRWREIRRAKAWNIWDRQGAPLDSPEGRIVRDYLASRGLEPGPGCQLRAAAALDYFADDKQGKKRLLGSFPAMLAPIRGPVCDARGRIFSGVHCTYLDPATGDKLQLHDPATGELPAAKKIQGSFKGGIIRLASARGAPVRMIAGEGIENVLSVYTALKRSGSARLEDTVFLSFSSLLNFSGKAANSVAHPTLKVTDKRGVERPKRVPGPLPKWPDDFPLVPISPQFRELIWLGDGDSEEVFTRHAVSRGAARYSSQYPWLQVYAAWADPGMDFNDMLQAYHGTQTDELAQAVAS